MGPPTHDEHGATPSDLDEELRALAPPTLRGDDELLVLAVCRVKVDHTGRCRRGIYHGFGAPVARYRTPDGAEGTVRGSTSQEVAQRIAEKFPGVRLRLVPEPPQ